MKGNPEESAVVFNRRAYSRVQRIATLNRPIPPAVNPFDKLITGLVSLEILDPDSQAADAEPSRLFASFSTRPSLLNRRLFSPLGQLGGVAATALLVVGAIFLVIEFVSLITGIVLTRTITTAVDDLYSATQHAQAGDLSFRVRVPHRDQLAALGDSFNSMMQSVSTLIEEQRQRQRLENELSIAQEVQQQLFPHSLPKLRASERLPPGQVAAIIMTQRIRRHLDRLGYRGRFRLRMPMAGFCRRLSAKRRCATGRAAWLHRPEPAPVAPERPLFLTWTNAATLARVSRYATRRLTPKRASA
jgi:HAMP domain-containing protein